MDNTHPEIKLEFWDRQGDCWVWKEGLRIYARGSGGGLVGSSGKYAGKEAHSSPKPEAASFSLVLSGPQGAKRFSPFGPERTKTSALSTVQLSKFVGGHAGPQFA